MVTTASAELIKRAVPSLAGILAARLVERPKVKRALRRVDAKVIGTAVRHRRTLITRRVLRVLTGIALMMFGAMLVGRRTPAASAQ